MAIRYFTSPTDPELETRHRTYFCVIPRTPEYIHQSKCKKNGSETGDNICYRTGRNQLSKVIFTNRKANHTLRKENETNSDGVWTIGWKWYLVMNQESALGMAIMLELSSDTVKKYTKMTAWGKQVNFSNPSLYTYTYTCHLNDLERYNPYQNDQCTYIHWNLG